MLAPRFLAASFSFRDNGRAGLTPKYPLLEFAALLVFQYRDIVSFLVLIFILIFFYFFYLISRLSRVEK